MNEVEGKVDHILDKIEYSLNFFKCLIDWVDTVENERDQWLAMALECLETAEEHRCQENADLEDWINDLASKSSVLTTQVGQLTGEMMSLQEQVCSGVCSFLAGTNP